MPTPLDYVNYSLGSGYNLSGTSKHIYERSVQYAKNRSKAEGENYLPGYQNDFYKREMTSYRKEYSEARKRRGSRDPNAKLDLTDQLLEQIAVADMKRKSIGRTRMSTFLGHGPIGQSSPNLATMTLLGGK